MSVNVAATSGTRWGDCRSRSPFVFRSTYGSMMMTQRYVPGSRSFASTWTGSVNVVAEGCGELPMFAGVAAESTQVIRLAVPPVACEGDLDEDIRQRRVRVRLGLTDER